MTDDIGKVNTGSSYNTVSLTASDTVVKALQNLFGGDPLTIVPDAGGVSGGAGSSAVVSLDEPSQSMNVENMILLLQTLASKISDEKTKASVTQIKSNATQVKSENQEYQKQVEAAQKKMDKAKKSGTWGKVFGWVGAVVGVVVAAALIATGVGAVAGGLILAGALVGLSDQVVTTAAPGWVAKHPAFTYAMMGVQLTLGIASLGAGFASAAASAATEAGEQVSNGLAFFAKTIPSLTTTAGGEAYSAWQAVKVVASVIAGVSTVGQGVSTGVGAVAVKESKDADADSQDSAAEIAKLQAFMDREMKRLKEMMEAADQGFQMSMDMLNGIAASKLQFAQRSMV